MTELEHALQSQRTTPVETEDVAMNAETWAAWEQVIWAELGKIREQMQDVPGCMSCLRRFNKPNSLMKNS